MKHGKRSKKVYLVVPDTNKLSKKGKRLIALIRKFIKYQYDYRVLMINRNKPIRKCVTLKGENLKNTLREAIRYMVEDKLMSIKIKQVSSKA